MEKLPLSAVVICLNESKTLKNCLQSIQFCGEILFFDLGSTDDSLSIAQSVPFVTIKNTPTIPKEFVGNEFLYIQSWVFGEVKNDWVLFIDPDESLDPQLQSELFRILPQLPESIAMINSPWLFYFNNKPLQGTFWGGDKCKTNIFNRNKIELGTRIHVQHSLKPGYEFYTIPNTGKNVIHHFWMDSYSKLLNKHLRYLKLEGKSLYELGERYSTKKTFKLLITSFYDSFIIYKGYKDGLVGLGLSVFYSWYIFSRQRYLGKYQKSIKSAN